MSEGMSKLTDGDELITIEQALRELGRDPNAITESGRTEAEEMRDWVREQGFEPVVCSDPRDFVALRYSNAIWALRVLFDALEAAHETALAEKIYSVAGKLSEVMDESRPTWDRTPGH